MLKLYCYITGDQYSMLVEDTPKSRQKVILMANALLLPVLVWAINGYLLAREVIETSSWVAVLTGGVCACVIFLVERIIIMSTANKGMKRFRMVLGICVALLGALALDEALFKGDIDGQINKNNAQYAEQKGVEAGTQFDSLNRMPVRLQWVQEEKKNIIEAENIAIREMDGRGSGVKGVGRIAQKKLEMVASRKNAASVVQQQYDSLLGVKTQAMKKASAEAAARYEPGLMIRIKALFQLVCTDWGMGIAYLVFTVMMFCIEFIVVMVKSITPETNYERRVRMIEAIGEKRIQLLCRNDSQLTDPGHVLPQAKAARKALEKHQSLYRKN
jgi:hypothetical protein